jgi:transcriptional regulator with XRE-family HTH domain
MSQSIIDAIKSEMSSKGISGRKLSEMSGVSMQYMYGILRGEHSPTIDKLAKLASALGMTIQLVEDREQAKAG